MSGFTYKVHLDGTIDISSGSLSLTGICPYVNERQILPVSLSQDDSSVCYKAAEGSITLSVREENDEIILSSEVEGFEHAHDIDPVGAAALSGADRVWVQGFGMEGPSGFFDINCDLKRSHGIVGLSGDREASAIFTTDQRKYSAVFSARDSEGIYRSQRIFSAGINLEKTNSGKVNLPDIHFICGADIKECMSRAAVKIAAEMRARTPAASHSFAPPAFHWCSWYYHYENLTSAALADFVSSIKDRDTGFNYIQIDAGYTPHIGDWLTANHRYPEGLSGAAKMIREAGFEAGIWIAPFMVGDQSDLYAAHPDWVLHNSDGTPFVRFRSYTEPKIWGNTDNDYYVIDMTHPEAFSHIRGVFENLKKYGFKLYKTDFMLWGMQDSSEVVRYNNSRTSVMVMRDTLAMIRSVIGEDAYLLGSIAPFMPCIGFMDGMRIASDMGAQWTAGAFGPANLLQELPYDNYFNNIFWQNDPDAVILRDFGTHLTEDETWSLALLQALSGGIITTSDPVEKLPADRIELLKLIKPEYRVIADCPFITDDREELVITHHLNDWDLLYVLNPSERPLQVHIRMDELFGSEALFQYRYNRNDGGIITSEKKTCFDDILEPHGSALLFITKEPLREKPCSLWRRRIC